jgi:hypothetical protein
MYIMHVAQRLVPGVEVTAYSREDQDGIAWGAQRYAEAANTANPGSLEEQSLLAYATRFIEAGGFAVRVTVEVAPEAVLSETPPTAAFDAQVQQLRILAN